MVSAAGFPASVPFTLILERDTALEEIVTVNTIAGANVTSCTRGADGTSAVAHNAGATVEHGVSARDFNEPQAHIAATTGVHGLAGGAVGTSDSQVLTNKTLNLGSNTLTGTTAQFNTALSDNDFATLAGNETLTNKTLTSPTTNTATENSPTINGGTLNAASTLGGVSGTALAASYAAWVEYTPTFTNCTGPIGHFRYRVDGKTLFIRAYISSGTATATAPVAFTLPAGLTAQAIGDAPCLGLLATKAAYAPGGGTTIATATNPTAGTSLVTTLGNTLSATIELA